MPQFHLWTGEQKALSKDQYFVQADDEAQARHLVALNADLQVNDASVWHCEPGRTHNPPDGVILTGGGQTVTIESGELGRPTG